ncbi:MAG: GspH/FimT family pseudopilin [Gammaproteobacteria bacterium]|nr:GspH/FimT family pseudopilin [Gammaproteobacteria bacterium]
MMTPISVDKPKHKQHGYCGSLSSSIRGFTLLEIILVLGIMAMVSLIVVPNITGLDSRTFSAQVREAHSLLNYARRIAVVSGQPSTASFYISTNNEDQPVPANMARSSVGQWNSSGIAVIYRDSADRETEIKDKIEITFYPEGGSTGGSLILSSQNRSASINVDPFSGRVAMEFLDEL